MITCPNCQHENPDGATVCELCFTSLPLTNSTSLSECPSCGAKIPVNATFCGECGFNLTAVAGVEGAVGLLDKQTQLQSSLGSLLHLQTNLTIELSPDLPVIHIGKPNETIPPDIDVSGFPNSQIVSRIHADIRHEEGAFFIEDTGSANGTYINHIPLPMGNRHCLQNGDRIALGKEDKVSFIFQLIG